MTYTQTPAVTLRGMKRSDIEDYVRWFTTETEWLSWDAPWDPYPLTDAATERAAWSDFYEQQQDRSYDLISGRFEVEWNGVHIGWVSSYKETEFMPCDETGVAIGIIIPSPEYRGRGAGTEVLRQHINYLMRHGYTLFYLETWSGNRPMMAVAEKLGFQVVHRAPSARIVDGRCYDALTFLRDVTGEYEI